MLFESHAVADLTRHRERSEQLHLVEIFGCRVRPCARNLGGAFETGTGGVDQRQHVGEVGIDAVVQLFGRRCKPEDRALLGIDDPEPRSLAGADEGRKFHEDSLQGGRASARFSVDAPARRRSR